MIIKSEQKHLIISPRKLRPIADVLRKLSVQKAIDLLPFIKKRGSNLILKVIKLKRGQPVSRGRWHPIKKRMSHIKIILMTKLETKHGTKS